MYRAPANGTKFRAKHAKYELPSPFADEKTNALPILYVYVRKLGNEAVVS